MQPLPGDGALRPLLEGRGRQIGPPLGGECRPRRRRQTPAQRRRPQRGGQSGRSRMHSATKGRSGRTRGGAEAAPGPRRGRGQAR
jgi:hypothetical protein